MYDEGKPRIHPFQNYPCVKMVKFYENESFMLFRWTLPGDHDPHLITVRVNVNLKLSWSLWSWE